MQRDRPWTPENLPLVLLAAGRSSRLGTAKALRQVSIAAGGSKALIAWQLDQFRAVDGRRVVVVLGHGAEAIGAALPPWPESAMRTVVNAEPERGPFSSLQCGLGAAVHAFGPFAGVYVLPVDVPVPSAPVWMALALALTSAAAAVPVCGGRGGHPVALSAELAAALIRIDPTSPEARLDRQLALQGEGRVKRVDVDDAGIHLNLNTEADWGKWVR